MPKRTLKPNKKRKIRKQGFRARMASKKGRAVLKRRIRKGRKKIS